MGVATNHWGFGANLQNSGWQPNYPPVPMITNMWVQLVGIYKQGQYVEFYVNGSLAYSNGIPDEILATNATFPLNSAIGIYDYAPGPYQGFDGAIDDVRIYNRALSSSEVQQLYAYESVPFCVSPPAGLVAWWPGEGNANDIAGTNNGTLEGGATFTNGEVGQAFDFDGSTGYVQVPDSDVWAFGTNNFTVELWANFNAVPPGTLIQPQGGSFIGYDEGTGAMNKWMFALGGGLLHLSVYNPSGGQVWLVQAPFTPSPHQWYHLAVVRNGNVFTMFVNGVSVGSETNGIAVPYANAPLTIGHSEAFYFNGLLDEVSIYRRSLSPNEIAAIYAAGSAGKCVPPPQPNCIPPPSGLVGWWPGEGNADDIAGTDNGTLLNGASFAAGEVGSGVQFRRDQWLRDRAGFRSLRLTNSLPSRLGSTPVPRNYRSGDSFKSGD